jgi:hypothetical protein
MLAWYMLYTFPDLREKEVSIAADYNTGKYTANKQEQPLVANP